MLGLSTSFIISLAIAVALGYYTHNYWNGIVIVLMYVVVKIVWRILRWKKKED